MSKKPKSRAKNVDLPAGAHDGHRFQRVFIPTLVWFLSFQDDAWKVDDKELIRAMQGIWVIIYGRQIPYKIKLNDAVFQVVSRSLYILSISLTFDHMY